MVEAAGIEPETVFLTKPLKTQHHQSYQWFQCVFAFSLRCNKKQQNPFRMIENDRFLSQRLKAAV